MENPPVVLLIVIMGFMVMLRLISVNKAMRFLGWIVLAAIFGPVCLSILERESVNYMSQPHEWWFYVVLFFGVLICIRLILNFIFPPDRRR